LIACSVTLEQDPFRFTPMHYRVIMAAISAVGIQHLDSLSDVVEKITAVWPRQTVPDQVVRTAGEIELVDAVPEALRERMARGHIYPAEWAAGRLRWPPVCVPGTGR
jgi:osmosensitive K+ channel His kinase sensor protein